MYGHCTRWLAFAVTAALALPPAPLLAQPKLPASGDAAASEFSIAQLDAMLAPIALYPDDLLTQLLMASTFPLQVVAAARWLAKDENKKLKGDALLVAVTKETWDPSVKSLVPFPQIIAMMNDHLDWLQQLGYAVANQQAAALDSIQRLRRQAQKAGSLKTTGQQRVAVQDDTVTIEPATPDTVYVPVYQPAQVYGDWPYPETPPVYIPPAEAYYPAAYAPGNVWGRAVAFAAGAAVVGGLWGWARPRWGAGNININTTRFNTINANRTAIQSGTWRAASAGAVGRAVRAPGGPVGGPRMGQLPANAIGRNSVQVPGAVVNRPQIAPGGVRPGQARLAGAGNARRPAAAPSAAAPQRLAGPRPGTGATQAPAVLRGSSASPRQSAGAFGGVSDGARASQFSARGAQSMGFQQRATGGGGGYGRGGGGFGGGGRRGR